MVRVPHHHRVGFSLAVLGRLDLTCCSITRIW
jgi:hypothetical protein